MKIKCQLIATLNRILKIISISSCMNCCFSLSSSHLFPALIKSATTVVICILGGVIGLKVLGLGSQLSLCTKIFWPFPARHLMPASITFLPHNMLLQTNEGLEPILACKKSELLKYLTRSTLVTRELGN